MSPSSYVMKRSLQMVMWPALMDSNRSPLSPPCFKDWMLYLPFPLRPFRLLLGVLMWQVDRRCSTEQDTASTEQNTTSTCRTKYCQHRTKYCQHKTKYCQHRTKYCQHRKKYCQQRKKYCQQRKKYCQHRTKYCQHRTKYCQHRTKHCQQRTKCCQKVYMQANTSKVGRITVFQGQNLAYACRNIRT